jgi:hypothetical protein
MESLVSEEWNIKKHTFYHYVSTALAIRTKTVIANTSIILNMRERKNLHNRVFHSLLWLAVRHDRTMYICVLCKPLENPVQNVVSSFLLFPSS